METNGGCWLSMTQHSYSNSPSAAAPIRNQAEEGEAEEKEGFRGEEHPAEIQDIRQPAAQRRTQEGRLQRSLQVPQR